MLNNILHVSSGWKTPPLKAATVLAATNPAHCSQYVLPGLSLRMTFSAVVTVVAIAPRIENPRSRRIFTVAIVAGNLAALAAMYALYKAHGG
ncbi:MAG: hypothetical protein HKL96_11860 [Phycisphaerales bacterium]|nr:hypothetical protein [Phycisphaerales bacterium]